MKKLLIRIVFPKTYRSYRLVAVRNEQKLPSNRIALLLIDDRLAVVDAITGDR